jgi:hypothetical protein
MLTAALGALLGQVWTKPRLGELRIAPEECLLGRAEGEATFSLFIGAAEFTSFRLQCYCRDDFFDPPRPKSTLQRMESRHSAGRDPSFPPPSKETR